MGKIQHLTAEGVKRAARRYFRMGKLTAQHPVRAKRQCEYQVGTYRCAVGAAMTKSTLSKDPDGGICDLLRSGVATVDYEPALTMIQMEHDAWARTSRKNGARHGNALRAKARFLELIGAA